jgi:ABC-type Fe3+/spermidine/putrescine transport system ATPase subunit
MVICEIKKVLRDFKLDINFRMENETLVIVGHSGCGKSTTLKALGGLLAPDEGSIRIGEKTYFDRQLKINTSPEDRGIGFLFQNYALFPHLTVYENVAYGLAVRKVPKNEQRRKVEETLQSLNIIQLIDSMPADLSGGEQQRVALARALILEPQLLLLDEPLSALDVTTRARVRRELKKTLSALKIPTIIVSHDYEDAISLGDRILVMDRGRVIQEGTSEELLIHPRSSFVADFSGTNYFAAQAEGRKEEYLRLHVSEWNQTLLSVVHSFHPEKGNVEDGKLGEWRMAEDKPVKDYVGQEELSLMIYPWDISIVKVAPEKSRHNILPGKVINILSYGNRARIEMEGSVPLTIELNRETLKKLQLVEGDSVYAVVEPSAVHVLHHEEKSVASL